VLVKFDGKHEIRAPRAAVYRALTDAAILQRSIPGCERMEKLGDDVYSTTISAGVGAIKGRFDATVKLEEVSPPEHYRIAVEGKGQPGFTKASGDLHLAEEAGATTVIYSAEVQVGGLIAAVGQRMLLGTARMMAGKFFSAIENAAQQLAQTDSAQARPA
jgi:carbon monoxide dehydrogenase subunit G